MTAADQCPTPADLEDFLQGRGAPDLEQHLAACGTCAARAAELRPDDALVDAVRRAAAGDTPLPELTEELVTVFRRMLPSAAGETVGWVEPPADLDAGAAGELGRVGPYPVYEVLGAGGMGVVYRGFDPALERPVAIKVIRPALLAAPGVVERFLAEARAAAKVEHDGIVVVHAVEVHAGRPCLVMPLLKGESLEARLKAGALPPGEVLRVGRETAAALAAAHDAGLVHRDIKPGNLWLEAPTGRVRVLDFGLAVAAGGGGSGFAGTPGYMAPEQVRGAGVDHRADLFSLGCVLYRMVAGVGPFDAETASGALIHTLTRSPAACPAAPQLAALIERLLSRSPADRPESAAAVAAELAALEGAAAARRRRVVRRRWLAGLVTAAGLGGLAAWFLQPPSAPAPVEITVTTDPDDGPLILTGADGDVRVAGGGGTAVSLLPGNYTVRPAVERAGRVPVPAAFVVQPDEPARVKVALVGEVAVTKAHNGPVTGVAVIRDGTGFAVLSSSLDRTVQRWEPGKADPRHADLKVPAECLAATPDGAVVLTGGGTKQRGPDAADPFGLRLQRWDGRTLTPAGDPLAGHGRIVKVLAVSADGRYAVSADRDEVIVWNLRGGDPVRLPTPARASVQAAAFDPNGPRVLIGDETGAATLRDAAKPDPPLRVFAPPGEKPAAVTAVAARPDGYATGCADGSVWLWDKAFTPKRVATPGEVLALAVSPDGRRLLAAGADGAVRLVSVPRGDVVHTFVGHGPRVRGVAFTPDGRGAASAGEDHTVRLWRLPFDDVGPVSNRPE